MSDNLENLPERSADRNPDLSTSKWTDVELASKLERHIVPDFETALHLIMKYQQNLDMLGAPDPDLVEARKLLSKYGMNNHRVQRFRIFVDETDITEHPDSTPGTAHEMVLDSGKEEEIEDAEVVELPAGEDESTL